MDRRKKLGSLGLQTACVDDILNAYDTYAQTIKTYDKPAGKAAMDKNLAIISELSKKLSVNLKGLSKFERQTLGREWPESDTHAVIVQLGRLTRACEAAIIKKIRFSRKRPFLLDLSKDVCAILQDHGHTVSLYHKNIFCQVMDLLIDKPSANESFELLRQVRMTHA